MRTGSIGLLALYLFALPATARADQDISSADRKAGLIPYALTLSGGVSLGSYEAGINWVILRYLKDTSSMRPGRKKDAVDNDLIAVTGASAGAINALISALAWCISPDSDPAIFPDAVGDNVLRYMWTSIGLERLLQSNAAYRSDDGLLTREAFAPIIGYLSDLIGLEEGNPDAIDLPFPPGPPSPSGKAIFKNGCKVHLGFTLTSERTRDFRVGGVSAPNQRYFVPLMLEVVDGRAKFYRASLAPGLPGMGALLVLPAKPGTEPARDVRLDAYEISNRSVLNLVLASSAFPIAFGRRMVKHCVRDRSSRTSIEGCPPGWVPMNDVFMDGGVFDNVPLGGTRSLAENGAFDLDRRVSYLFINPDNLRTPVKPGKDHEIRDRRYGLKYQLQFLGGALDTARSHELYAELDSGDWTRQLSALMRDFRELAESPDRTLPKDLQDAINRLQASVDQYEYNLQYEPDKNLAKDRITAFEGLGAATNLLLKDLAGRPRGYDRLVTRFQTKLDRARNDKGGDRRVMLSSRFFPVTGEHLYAFGAFFDEPFRDFDYYVGVYDAVHGIAKYICDVKEHVGKLKDKQAGSCHGDTAKGLYQHSFRIDRDSKARYVFVRLAQMEHRENEAGWDWILSEGNSEPADESLRHLETVLDSLGHFETIYHPKTPVPTHRVVPVEGFEEFLHQLRARNYYSPETSVLLRRTLKDGKMDKWWTGPAALAAGRLAYIEKQTHDDEEKFRNGEKTARNEKETARRAEETAREEAETARKARRAAHGDDRVVRDAEAKLREAEAKLSEAEANLRKAEVKLRKAEKAVDQEVAGPQLVLASKRAANAAQAYDQDRWLDFVSANQTLPWYLPREWGAAVGEKVDARALYVSWEWQARLLHNEVPLFVHLAPVQHMFEPEPVGLTQAGLRVHGDAFAPGVTGGGGIDLNWRWTANPETGRSFAWGASFFLEWKCLRATLGFRDLTDHFQKADNKFAQDGANRYLNIALVF